MKLKFNPFTGKFDWVISRLSELASRPHSDLTDVTPDQHHPQVHGAADHLPESDAEAIHDNVAGEIAALPEKTIPNVADLLLIEDSAAGNVKKKVKVGNLSGGGGGSGGHEIQEDGTALPQRAALNFGQGLVAQDNATQGRTDVNVEYGGQGDVAPADAGPASAGTLPRLARADHKHSASVGTPVDLADSNQEGSATTLAKSDHAHRRSVRVKSGTDNYVRNALDIIGLGVTDDALDDEIEIVHDASSPGHHAQFHDDSDHTSPSRVEVQDEGTAVAQRAVLNFVGDGVTVSDDAQNGRVNINIPGGGTGTAGHEIQEDGTALPQRSGLNFAAGLIASDNSVSDRTDVSLDYGAAADVSNVDASASAPGSLSRVARADHRHAASIGTPVDLGDANADGTASTLARSDHVHKRSVRVKSDTSDFARNALNISGLGVADGVVNDEIDIIHDASSSGHHPQAHDHSSAADGDALFPAVLNLPKDASPAQTVEGQVVWDSTNDKLTVGDGTGRRVMAREDQAVMDGDAAGGELTGTYPNPAVATVHAGSAHHAQVHAIDGSDHTGVLDIGDPQLPAPPDGYPADVAAASADGTSARVSRADHVHAHGSGYLPDAHHSQAHGDNDHTSPSRIQVQDEGVAVAARTTLNFVGDGVTVSDDVQNDRVNISIPGGGGFEAHAIDGADHTGTLDIGDAQLPAPPTGYAADVATTKGDGTSARVARADHVHAHGTGYLPNAHHNQVHDVSDHTGTIGKVYTTLLWYLDGDVEVGDGQGATPYLEDVVDKIRIRAAVDTAPAGQDLIAEINHSTDRTTWSVVGTVTIADGSTTGETTLAAGTLQPGWYRLDINQVGSSTAGSDLTVMFVCKRPVTAS